MNSEEKANIYGQWGGAPRAGGPRGNGERLYCSPRTRRGAVYRKLILAAAAGAGLFVPIASAQNITFNQADRLNQYYPYDMTVADLNHDGYPDLMFSLPSSFDLYTLMSNGTGQYVDWTIPTVYCPSAPIGVGDFQRNGNQSILVGFPSIYGFVCGGTTSPGVTFSEYSNNGSGIFSEHGRYPGMAVAGVVADFNGDHKLDYVGLGNDNWSPSGIFVQLYYGDGYGGFSNPYRIEALTPETTPTGYGFNITAGDFDGNGCPDVAWVEQSGGPAAQKPILSVLRVAYGDCKGDFNVTTAYSGNIYLNTLHTTDLNRDGVSDLVATWAGNGTPTGGVQIFYGQKGRTFAQKTITDNEASDPLVVADLNGNGYPDIAYVDYVNPLNPTSTTLVIRQGDASQAFTAESTYPFSTNQVDQMRAGDFNHDGKTDLAVLYSGPSVPSNEKGFSFLYNTSSYPGGACPVPAGPGINVCSPGATSGTAVNVLAAGNVDNPAVYLELWVDGARVAGYGSTNELRTTITLTPGRHALGFVAIDAAGNKVSKTNVVTVQ
ncbi:VCBS repeat-containing protein [Acidobacteria bacterium AB60]|nr:VCBS repeat-containing protein [Acidobacteria bacterium AB60]